MISYLIIDPKSIHSGGQGQALFFCPYFLGHILLKFCHEKTFDFQNFLSWELALVYTMLDHIKLNFHPSNPWSQRAFCQSGQNHYIQAKN